MIQRKLMLWMMAVSALSAGAALAQGGGEGSKGGGGGDVVKSTTNSRWFSSESKRPVRFCMTVSKEFGVKPDDLEQLIRTVYGQWLSYAGRTDDPRFNFPEELVALKSCKGQVDLKFYFGTASAEVERAKAKYDNPYSFAQRTAVGSTYWGRGLIWFANPGTVDLGLDYQIRFPNWSGVKDQLHAALLHEMGHVFGTGHVPGTIMREDLWKIMNSWPDEQKRTRIDHNRVLISHLHDHQLNAKMAMASGVTSKFIRELTGVDADPEATVTIERSGRDGLYLSFDTTEGPKRFFIKWHADHGDLEVGDPLFKSPYDYGSLRSKTFMTTGEIKSLTGQPSVFQIEYNLGGVEVAPWSLYVDYQGKRHFLANFNSDR